MSEVLRECPFCHGEAILKSYDDFRVKKYFVQCRNYEECGGRILLKLTEDEAITAWNRRAQPDNPPQWERDAYNEMFANVPNVKPMEPVNDNPPLSLEQLRQVGGEPVWIVEYPDWGHWELSEDAEDYLFDRDPDFYGMKHNDPAGKYGLHVLGWLAYAHRKDGDEG